MFCEIARQLDDQKVARIAELEAELGLTLVAFSCREMEAERAERLRAVMEQFGPVLQAEPATPDDTQLARLRAAEDELGLTLIAVRY